MAAPARLKLVMSQLELVSWLNCEAMTECVAKRMDPSALPTTMPDST